LNIYAPAYIPRALYILSLLN